MKKILFVVISVALFAACSKESDYNTTNDGVVKIGEGEYAITAYFEDMTKASINSSSGAFSWDGSEQIAVWDSHNKEFVTFTIASGYTASSARFTTTEAKANASFGGNVAYYPASIADETDVNNPTYAFPTSHASLSAAAKSFPMQGTVTTGEIKFSHLGSMIDLTLNNVPSFTTELILSAGATNITIAATPTAGSIHAVAPIPAGTYVLTVKLKDDNATKNIFYSKGRSSKTYTVRNYYKINTIQLGYLLSFTNDASWASPKVHIWQTSNDSNNTDITVGGTYPHELFLRNTKEYYCLLDGDVETWTAEGSDIGVQFYSSDSNKTETSCVYLYRNIDFTIPAGGGLKTDYRVYFNNNSNWETVKAFVWGDVGIYVRWYVWSDRRVYYRASDNSSWGWGTPTSNDYRKVYGFPDTYAFYEVGEAFHTKTISYLGIGVDGNAWEVTDSDQKTFNNKSQFFRRWGGNNAGGGFDQTESTKKESLTDSYPGNDAGCDNGLYYYTFSSSCYGYGYNIIFNDGSTNKNIDTHLLINREYTLPL